MTGTKIVSTDVGGSHLCSAIVNIDTGEILNSSLYNTYFDAFGTRESIVDVWRAHFSQFQAYKRFAVALPGPFDYQNGIAHYFSEHKLGALTEESFYDLFLNEIVSSDSLIKFENDAKCFGLGAALSIPNREQRNLLFLTLGTGLGSCIIKKGVLIDGSDELYQLGFKNGTVDDYFSTRWFVNYIKSHHEITYEGVREIIKSEDPDIVQGLFEIFCLQLTEFLTPVISEHQIDHIVLGGSISKAGELINQHLEPLLNEKQVDLSLVSDSMTCALKGAATLYNTSYEISNRMR